MLNDTTLKNKANIWQSNDNWKLETINQSIYIENMSNHTVLGIAKTDIVIAEDLDQYKFGEAWIKGEPDNEGFFTLTNMKSRKLLTAISAKILKVMGKFCTIFISSLNPYWHKAQHFQVSTPLSFLDQILLAGFFSKISKHFWR